MIATGVHPTQIWQLSLRKQQCYLPIQQPMPLPKQYETVQRIASHLLPVNVFNHMQLAFSNSSVLPLNLASRFISFLSPKPTPPGGLSLPNDFWQFFLLRHSRDVLSRRDLLQIASTCKLFHSIAIAIIYQEILWNDATHFLQSLHMWSLYPELAPRVHSLTIGITEVPVELQLGISVVGVDGNSAEMMCSQATIVLSRVLRLNGGSMSSFASSPLLAEVYFTAATFVNLETLVFRGTILPSHWHVTIHAFPHLRVLHIHSCIVTDAAEPIRHTGLPIEELRLLNITRHHCYFAEVPAPVVYPRCLDSIASSPSISTLHLDATSLTELALLNSSESHSRHFRHLHVHATQPTHYMQKYLAESTITWLLENSPHLESLSITDTSVLPSLTSTPAFVTAPGLSRFRGTWSALMLTKMRNCPGLLALELRDGDLDARGVSSVVSRFPNLRVFSMLLNRQLSEYGFGRGAYGVLVDLSRLKQLVRLRIVCPTEVSPLSRFAMFNPQFTIHIIV